MRVPARVAAAAAYASLADVGLYGDATELRDDIAEDEERERQQLQQQQLATRGAVTVPSNDELALLEYALLFGVEAKPPASSPGGGSGADRDKTSSTSAPVVVVKDSGGSASRRPNAASMTPEEALAAAERDMLEAVRRSRG
jgi:hypothetical protein